jgi:hypothetical protein
MCCSSYLENLGRQTDRALDAEVLGLGALKELSADLLERLDLARGEGDADLVDFGALAEVTLLWLLERHVCRVIES